MAPSLLQCPALGRYDNAGEKGRQGDLVTQSPMDDPSLFLADIPLRSIGDTSFNSRGAQTRALHVCVRKNDLF